MKKYFLLIALSGFLLYLPSLFGPFLWDDEDFVYANKYVENFQIDKFFTESQTAGRGKLSNYFRPIPQIIYASVHAAVGFNPFWYHLVNVLAHIAAACAIYYFFHLLLLKRIPMGGTAKDPLNANESGPAHNFALYAASANEHFKDGRGDRTYLVPFFISLLFLIHPIQTEAISYISGLSDPLFVFFGFLALARFLLGYWVTGVLFFTLALLSKEAGIVFLSLLLLLQLLISLPELTKQLVNGRGVFVWLISSLKKIWTYSAITLVYLWYHTTFINQFDTKAAWGDNPYTNSVVVRILTFLQNLPTYLTLLLFPKDLFMERDYSISIQTQLLNPYLLGFILLLISIIVLLRKLNANRYPLTALWFCFLAFFISFLPYSGIVLINGIFYEHFLYLPLVFFFGFLVFLLPRNKLLGYCFIGLLVLLAARNIFRQFDWIDPVRFYSQTLSHAPQSIRIRNGLAMAYADRGNYNLAIEQYNNAIKINPAVPNLYHNLANTYLAIGENKLAEENYLKAIEVDSKFFFSYQSLANLYQKTGQKDKLDQLIKRFQTQNQQ